MKNEKLTIEDRLESIKKTISKAINPDKIEEDEIEEEYEDEEEIEKAEEDDIEEEYEEEIDEDDIEEEYEEEIDEDDIEDELDIEYDYDELTRKLTNDLGINGMNQRMDDYDISLNEINEQLSQIVSLLETNTNVVADVAEENNNVEKSISKMEKILDKVMATRKSVKNVRLYEKFDEKGDFDVDKLSKSEKASILANAYENGNRSISISDISTAEINGYLNDNSRKVIIREIKNRK